MKINLGSASRRLDDFKNVDVRPDVDVDIPWDITEIPWVFAEENSIEAIIAEEVFEHISWLQINKVLKEVYRVMRPGGWMVLTVPDIGKMCLYYVNKEICDCVPHKEPKDGFKADPNCPKCGGRAKCNPMRFKQALAGAQKHPWDIHRNQFFKEEMIELFEKIGFKVTDISPDNLYKIKLKVVK